MYTYIYIYIYIPAHAHPARVYGMLLRGPYDTEIHTCRITYKYKNFV